MGFFDVAAPGGELILKAAVVEISRRYLSHGGLAISELLKIVMCKGEGGFEWLGGQEY
jgi:hypothetical protein